MLLKLNVTPPPPLFCLLNLYSPRKKKGGGGVKAKKKAKYLSLNGEHFTILTTNHCSDCR